MTVIEAITIYLAPAIAKALLKQWLKDSSIAAESSSSLVDIIKAKTTDLFTEGRAKRQFEAIGERVAENLVEIINIEWANVPENGRIAAIRAAAETLNKAGIKAELVLETNLDPKNLADYLLAFNPNATSLLSTAETELYKRVLQDSSQYIVDIASQLPQFNERTFAEILKKENHIGDVANQVLSEVRRIRATSDQTDVQGARFQSDYRLAVLRNLDELQLFGVDLSPASGRHRLSVAYVTLSVKQNEPSGSINGSIRAEHTPNNIEEELKKETLDSVGVDTTLSTTSRLLILGDAGSGKTTLLQWIAVRSAQKDFEGALYGWNETIPFFIRLRQCADTGLPPPEEFRKFVSEVIAGSMPQGWVHEQLDSGRAVVLIDGLDELGKAKRDAVHSWLKELVHAYGKAKYILSSRPYAADVNWLESEGFTSAELLPMDLPDINSFVDQWHEAVREQIQEEEDKSHLYPLADDLKETIRSKSQIRKLATNPLLCAMLCALNRDRQQQLPSDRIELYDACIHMLIERRDIERKVDLRDYPSISFRQKRVLLQDIAYWLIKNGYSMVSVQQAEKKFDEKLKVMENIPRGTNGEKVRKLFVERSGILREPIKEQIDFSHRTFQEFLAAHSVLDEGDLGLLARNAHDEQWREVVVLAAGIARANERNSLIRKLIERGDKESVHRQQLHLLAVACLETSVELEPGIKTEVTKRMRRLIPPRKMGEAKALASAGELAIPFLRKKSSYGSYEAAACIRTLSLIGTDEALNALESYATDDRQYVTTEIGKAWDAFDREEYVRLILNKRTELSLNRPSSLEGFQYCENISSLHLWNCSRINDFDPLNNVSSLERLVMFESHFANIDFLSHLDNLELLGLYWFPRLDNIMPLVNLTKLKTLTISGMQSLNSVEPLSQIKSLRTLRLQSVNINTLIPLASLSSLTSLAITNCAQVTDLTPLCKLGRLHLLSLRGFTGKIDLSSLRHLGKKTKIKLWVQAKQDYEIPIELKDRVSVMTLKHT